MLTRYGGDLEMNLNLFLQPAMAAEELDMKIGAQREALEQTLNDIGYETIMNEGTYLTFYTMLSYYLYYTTGLIKMIVLTRYKFGARSSTCQSCYSEYDSKRSHDGSRTRLHSKCIRMHGQKRISSSKHSGSMQPC